MRLRFSIWIFVLSFILFFAPQIIAQTKVVVVPLFEKAEECCVCAGTIDRTRWCFNGDGTITDMTTCLVWLRNAGWGGKKPWRRDSTDCNAPNFTCYDDAHTRAGILTDGMIDSGLSDGSVSGQWRLPTKLELQAITQGEEPITQENPRLFTGIPPIGDYAYFWTSTTNPANVDQAWYIRMSDGGALSGLKDNTTYFHIWAVRDAN